METVNSPAPVESGTGTLLDSGTDNVNIQDTLLGNSATPPEGTGTDPGFQGSVNAPADTSLPPQEVQGLAPLPENASDDQKRDFENKLRALAGVPNEPSGYGTFGFPADVKIDTNSAVYKRWTDVFHKAGLNSAQAKQLLEAHTQFVNDEAATYKQVTDRQIADYRAQMKANLVRETGGEANYEVMRSTAQRGFSAVAKGAKLNENEITGMLNIMGDDSRFVKMFAHIGKNFREDVLITGSTPSAPEQTFDSLMDSLFK